MVITGVGVDVASTTHVPRVTNMSRGKSLSEVECGKIPRERPFEAGVLLAVSIGPTKL